MKEQIVKMQKEIEQLKIESKEKDDAILELSHFYYVSYIIIFFYSIIRSKILIVNLSMKTIMRKM